VGATVPPVTLRRARRGIINPIGDFPEFLKKCDSIPRDAEGGFVVSRETSRPRV